MDKNVKKTDSQELRSLPAEPPKEK